MISESNLHLFARQIWINANYVFHVVIKIILLTMIVAINYKEQISASYRNTRILNKKLQIQGDVAFLNFYLRLVESNLRVYTDSIQKYI